MAVTYTWALQAYIASVWTDISRDVEIKRAPLDVTRGIDGADITNRVASPGRLTAQLDNDTSNSGSKVGYYSPGHANMRANFGRNTRVRLAITYSGTTYYKFHGWISDLQPTPGQFKDPYSTLIALDYMQKLTEARTTLLSVQESKRSDQLISTLLSNMVTAPLNQSLDTDRFELPYALSQEQDEKTFIMGAMQKVCQTALAYAYVRGNTTDGETFVYQREATRAANTSAATLTNTMTEMTISRGLDKVKNKLVGIIHPTRVDTGATTNLYSLENEIRIPGNDSVTINLQYRDPANKSTRISGKNIVTPLVADTHYKASLFSGTTANDANASLSITPTVGGNATKAVMANTSGSAIYVNTLNLLGDGIYFYSPVEIARETGSADKIANYDFYYLSDQHRARQFLVRLLNRSSSETAMIESVSFFADENATLMGYAMTLDIGDRVTIVETATGLSGQYTINRVGYTIETNRALRCTWGLEPADTSSYFILNSSLLNGANVLSPY